MSIRFSFFSQLVWLLHWVRIWELIMYRFQWNNIKIATSHMRGWKLKFDWLLNPKICTFFFFCWEQFTNTCSSLSCSIIFSFTFLYDILVGGIFETNIMQNLNFDFYFMCIILVKKFQKSGNVLIAFAGSW